MRIGYGYRRSDKDFDAWDCDRVFVDSQRTEREERATMFHIIESMGEPVTLFMFKPGELGYGRELKQLRERLAALGVSLEYPPAAPDGRGRPPKFNPTAEQIKVLRRYWHDQAYSQAYCIRKASELMGHEVKRHQLIYKLGNRER